jgi:hypothetical protein
MDSFTSPEILQMLEGGNGQFRDFLSRQSVVVGCGGDEGMRAYRTKAARYYRESLRKHVEGVVGKGVEGWEGRVRKPGGGKGKKGKKGEKGEGGGEDEGKKEKDEGNEEEGDKKKETKKETKVRMGGKEKQT